MREAAPYRPAGRGALNQRRCAREEDRTQLSVPDGTRKGSEAAAALSALQGRVPFCGPQSLQGIRKSRDPA